MIPLEAYPAKLIYWQILEAKISFCSRDDDIFTD